MYNFEVKIPTEIYFGINTEEKLGKLMKEYARKVMLVYGSERIFETGLGDTLVRLLEKEGVQVVKMGGVKVNAEEAYLREAIKKGREEKIEGIVAVGGGSVMDSAKAISASIYSEADLIEIFDGSKVPDKFIPIGTVVTLPATASEANGGAVITEKDGKKLFAAFEGFKPKFALLNPELTLTVSPYQTAVGGFDIFAHAFERYFDLSRNSKLLDNLTIGLMKTVVELLPRLIDNPFDMQGRSEIMYAATVAHSNMLGPGGDFACHSISHGITKSFDISHGGALAMIIPAWCEYMAPRNEERFKAFYKEVFGANSLDAGLDRLESFVRSIGLPLKMNCDCDEGEYLAALITEKTGFVGGNFVKMYKEDVAEVCKKFMVTVA